MLFRPNKTSNRLFILHWILIGSLTSCATSNVATYPDSWAEPVTKSKDACPDIAGEFENKAIDAPSNEQYRFHQNHPVFLSDFLTSGLLLDGYKHKWITKVKLSKIKEGRMTAQFYKIDKIIHSKSFTLEKDFICTEKSIVFESSYTKIYEIGGGIGRRVTKLILSKNKGGALLLTEDFSESGIASVLIPIPSSQKKVSMYRFNNIGKMQ